MSNVSETPKVDFTKSHKYLYTAGPKFKTVEAGTATYLSVEGKGEPGGQAYTDAIGKIYSVAYTTKFGVMKPKNFDFKVAPLECLWLDDPCRVPRSEWRWQLLVRIPEQVTQADLDQARAEIKKKHGEDVTVVRRISWSEGKAVQTMHVGPYEALGQTYERVMAFMQENGMQWAGPAHEIYISDPRRTAPEKIKTIVRAPIA